MHCGRPLQMGTLENMYMRQTSMPSLRSWEHVDLQELHPKLFEGIREICPGVKCKDGDDTYSAAFRSLYQCCSIESVGHTGGLSD